jgi:hypothetical protein
MAAGDVQVQLANVRRHHGQIAAGQLGLTQEFLQLLAQNRAIGQPQRQTGANQL